MSHLNGPWNIWIRRMNAPGVWSMLGIEYPTRAAAEYYLAVWVEERRGKPDGVVLAAGEKPLGEQSKRRKRGL